MEAREILTFQLVTVQVQSGVGAHGNTGIRSVHGQLDSLAFSGRLQSRIYTKRTDEGQIERVAYEISALSAQILEQEM